MGSFAAGISIQRMSSIESEPRTLSYDQIRYAREAALYVLNNKSIEEAVSIFTKGLETSSSKKPERGVSKNNVISHCCDGCCCGYDDGESGGVDESEYQIRIVPAAEAGSSMDFRDIVTAPF